MIFFKALETYCIIPQSYTPDRGIIVGVHVCTVHFMMQGATGHAQTAGLTPRSKCVTLPVPVSIRTATPTHFKKEICILQINIIHIGQSRFLHIK